MQAEIFTDGIYHGEQHFEFDPHEVVSIEERSESLLFRGKHQVTQITLKNGAQWVLRGSLKAQIEQAQREALT